MSGIADFTVLRADGTSMPLSEKAGSVLLIVNTASKCGFTPQYEGLESLYRTYSNQGFEILAFPCNQFGAQEPGGAEEIARFCSLTYDVTFPVLAKVDVNGPDAIPLYDWLKSEKPGLLGSKAIKWNFTKFLVSREGQVVGRWGPSDRPERLKGAIEEQLAQP